MNKLIISHSFNKIERKNAESNSCISGNTKAMADAIAEGIMSRNVAVMNMNFHEARIEEIKAADAIAIGSSTFYYKMN